MCRASNGGGRAAAAVLLVVALILGGCGGGGRRDLAPAFEPGGIAGKIYDRDVPIDSETLPAASGGDGVLTYTLTPDLPAGLAFDPATRVLSGTPTEAQAETLYTYTATDSDAVLPDSVSLTFTIAVEAVAAVTISTAAAEVDEADDLTPVLVTLALSEAVQGRGCRRPVLHRHGTAGQRLRPRRHGPHRRRGANPGHDDAHGDSGPGGGARRIHHPGNRCGGRQGRNRLAVGRPRRHPRSRRAAAGRLRGVGHVPAALVGRALRRRHGRPVPGLQCLELGPRCRLSHPRRSPHHDEPV